MLVLERRAAERAARDGERAPATRAWPVVAMAAGAALVVAALVVVQLSSSTAAPGLTLGGPADVAVQAATYEAGQTSGWHSHTGMHAVTVLSGTMTFYDGACQPRTYGSGETYVGGQDIHLARNDTAEPAQLAVTYLFPSGRSHTTFHVAAEPPAGCDVR